MRERNLVALYVFSLFTVFFVILASVIFVVLVESGIIPLGMQPLSVSSFSCTQSGTVVNLHKSVQNKLNVAAVAMVIGSSSVTIRTNYTLTNSTSVVYLPYKCLSSNYVKSISVYYSDYVSVESPQNNINDFFSKLISDTRS
jgi:hypothetical protein